MKKIFLFISIFTFVALACDLSVTVVPTIDAAPLPSNTMIPATGVPTQVPASATSVPATLAPNATPTHVPATAAPNATATQIPVPPTRIPPTLALIPTPTAQPLSTTGTVTTYGVLTLVIPFGVADGSSGGEFPRVDGSNAAEWQKTPGHLQVMLGDYYVLKGKSNQPQIYLFPAQSYAELVPAAFESMHRLNNILGNNGAQISTAQLPEVPFFNARQVFASNIQVISFQNGRGVRFLTEYAQYPASANNNDLFYEFQGFTSDGAYYIVAIMPLSTPMLADTSDAGAALPPGGVPYPYMANPNADMPGYYRAVTALLNSAPQETFTPTLNHLDLMIQSMRVTP